MENKFEKKHDSLSDIQKHQIHQLSRVMTVFGLLVLGASLIGIPFPFSRVLWIRSLLGVSGLINSGLFVLIAKRIRKFSLPAVFAGLGVLLYEQVLVWTAFITVTSKSPAQWQDWACLLSSIGAVLFLLFFIFPVINPLCNYIKATPRKLYMNQHILISEKKWQLQTETLVMNLILYSGLFIAAWQSTLRVPLEFHYAAFKVLSEAVCVLSLLGIAQEVIFFLEEMQSKLLCMLKICTHLLATTAFFYLLLHQMPFEQFIVRT